MSLPEGECPECGACMVPLGSGWLWGWLCLACGFERRYQ
jgi:hypothetical protein